MRGLLEYGPVCRFKIALRRSETSLETLGYEPEFPPKFCVMVVFLPIEPWYERIFGVSNFLVYPHVRRARYESTWRTGVENLTVKPPHAGITSKGENFRLAQLNWSSLKPRDFTERALDVEDLIGTGLLK